MKNKMKILLYGDFYDEASGFAKEFRDIIPTFLKEGHEVRQVALSFNGLNRGKTKIHCYPTRIHGVASHFAPEVLEFAIKDFQPDIILSIQDYFALPYLVPVISKPYKKPFKFIHWGVADGEPLDKQSTSASKWVNHHIFHGKYGKKVLEKSMKVYFNYTNGIDGDVVYPAVDKKTFYPLKKNEVDKLRKQYGFDNKFVVFFNSRNQFRKNTPVLFEAIRKIKPIIPNIRLLINSITTVGINGNKEGYDLSTLAKYYDIDDCVASIKGSNGKPISIEAINKLYNVSDAVCVPTMGEGFGLFLTEAMAVGKPVISTDCSVVSEILAKDRGRLVKPSANLFVGQVTKHALVNSDDLANAIFAVYHDKKLRNKYVENGKKFVNTITPKKTAKKLLDIFEKVIREDKMPLSMEE